MRILLTGLSGFIGGHLARRLIADGHQVIGVVRRHRRAADRDPVDGLALLEIEDLETEQGWAGRLDGVDAVVHLAARVHVMRETEADPLRRFREVNVHATQRLAEAAAASGVGRFVYLSSIKVNGERTRGRAFTADDPAAPQDPYAQSKHEAEQLLRDIGAHSAMACVIVRPPLVYGPGVGGNLERLMRLVRRGVPLPLGAIDNRRSMVSIDNLNDFIATCLTHPHAADQTFLVADGQDWSTPDLIRAIAAAMALQPRLLPVPVWLLKGAAGLLGRRAVADRLCDSLQVDIRKNRELLGWLPSESAQEVLQRTAAAFLAEARDA